MKIFLVSVFILVGVWMWGLSQLPSNYNYLVYKFADGNLQIETNEVSLKFQKDWWIKTAFGKGEAKIGNLSKLSEKYDEDWLNTTVAEVLGNGIATDYKKLKIGDKITLRLAQDRKEKSVETDEKIAPDGEKLFYLGDKWQRQKKDIYLDSNLAREQTNVQVENASGIAGLGSLAADSIDATGAHVFDVSKSDTLIQRCKIQRNKNLAKSYLVNWLKDRFECEVEDGEGELILIKIGTEWGEKVRDFLQ